MSSRRRVSPGRLLVLIGLALLLWFLFEMNRFLPGVWPGGAGQGGSRALPAGTRPDPGRVVPSKTPPPPPRRPDLVRVTVRASDGGGVKDGRLTLRSGGARLDETMTTGTAEFTVPPGPVEAVELEREGRRLLHGAPPASAGRDFDVTWPRAPLPAKTDAPTPTSREVRVVDENGRAVPDAQASVSAGGKDTTVTAGAEGRFRLRGLAAPVARLCVTAPEHGETCVYASVEVPGPLVVRVPTMRVVRTTFVAAETGAPLAPETLRLVSPEGTPATVSRPESGFQRFEQALPADFVAKGFLEIVAAGRPPLRVPLRDLGASTSVPAGRTVTVRVADPAGAALPGVLVTARFGATSDAESSDASTLETTGRTDAKGIVALPIPAGRAATLVADTERHAPAGAKVPSGTADAGASLTVGPARALSIAVADENGRPLAGARVIALVRAGEATVRRVATTDASGAARLAGLPSGRVEVFAHAAGHAWGAATVEEPAADGAPPATLRLELAPGLRLLLVVEDPDGVPLPGVSVRSAPRGGPDPVDPDAVPWVTDAHGVLAVDDLPDRELDLYLHADGRQDEVLSSVRPGPITWFATMVPTSGR